MWWRPRLKPWPTTSPPSPTCAPPPNTGSRPPRTSCGARSVRAPARLPASATPRRWPMADSGAAERVWPVINAPIGHDSAPRHVSGEALYIDDIPEPPGLLHLYVGQSTRAHARITKLDLSNVRAAPGVVAVLTPSDVPGKNRSEEHTSELQSPC